MKNAILIVSDPASNSQEALGRLFNALAFAHESHVAGDEIEIVFKGAGTRWPAELARLDHPAHGLFQELREHFKGVSCGCSEVFNARAGAEAAGAPVLTDTPLPGTPGIAGIRRYFAEGWNVTLF
ncbi:MAG: hypothetical protein SFV32_03320 [Opitutaceae bacterium]|nr:hypothetical protein [Opitutaceae bacterium]